MSLARANSAPLVFAAALALIGAAPQTSRAQTALPLVPDSAQVPQPPLAIPPITIRIAVATASEAEGEMDPKALDIYEHLPAKYQSIRLIDERTLTVVFGEVARVGLPTGTEVRLVPVAVHGGQLHLQLEMPELLNTSMRMSNSRAFYVGGVPYEGGTLVFKLVPEFSAYIESPVERAETPQTHKARASGKR
jgi:hypothetical protein